MSSPWDCCACGHPMLLHDVEDLAGSNATCCVEGCNQAGCPGEQPAPTGPGRAVVCTLPGHQGCTVFECRPAPPDEPASFVCPVCGARSYNPNDLAHGYCGNCHDYTGDPVGVDHSGHSHTRDLDTYCEQQATRDDHRALHETRPAPKGTSDHG